MTPVKHIRNFPASVHQRLLNLAHNQALDFQDMLDIYASERFLYRLSIIDEVDRFVLKGATLFRVWDGREARPTRDLDFLDMGSETRAPIHDTLAAICLAACPEDGVRFDPATIRISAIRGIPVEGAVRARIMGYLGRIQQPLQIDIGVGDPITPDPEKQEYPTLLDFPAPRLWTYPRETVVAEKLHAMVERGAGNTRVKDLWDVAHLAHRFPFDGEVLRTAITATFRQRGTSLAGDRPRALHPAYYEEPMRERLWRKLLRKVEGGEDRSKQLVDVGNELREFLGPICDSLTEDRPFAGVWQAGGPWRPKAPE